MFDARRTHSNEIAALSPCRLVSMLNRSRVCNNIDCIAGGRQAITASSTLHIGIVVVKSSISQHLANKSDSYRRTAVSDTIFDRPRVADKKRDLQPCRVLELRAKNKIPVDLPSSLLDLLRGGADHLWRQR